MDSLKISELPAVTIPLAGSEQIPLVQSGETRRADASLFGAPIQHPGFRPNRIYAGNWSPIITSGKIPENQLCYHPVLIPRACSVTHLQVFITAAASGPGTANILVGLYSADAAGQPATRLASSPPMAITSQFDKVYELGTPLALQPGLYWAATLSNAYVNTGTMYHHGNGGLLSWMTGCSENASSSGLTTVAGGLLDPSRSYSQGLPTTAGLALPNTNSVGAVFFRVAA